MRFDLAETLEILRRTPDVLSALLRDLPERWTARNEGGDSWSPWAIVGHLIHGERADWIARARIIREEGLSRPFDPFDRFAQFEESKGKSMQDLLDEFRRRRDQNLAVLESWNPGTDDLAKKGRHPEFGPVTLEQLLATWLAHDLSHVAQIARVLAKQQKDEVGPWAAYLPLLGDRPTPAD